MDKAGIEKALVLGGDIMDTTTERLLIETATYPKRLYPVGSISPLTPKASVKKVEGWLSKKQIHGLKFYPGYEYFYPADGTLRPYLELLVKYNRPAIFHSGDTYNVVTGAKLKYAHALHIDDLATELPELKIIIAHLGYPWIVDAAEVCYKNKNVYVDCSGFVYGKFGTKQKILFHQIIKQFINISDAPERILFGTDWAIGDQLSYLKTMQSIVGKKFDTFYFKNAITLFGIE